MLGLLSKNKASPIGIDIGSRSVKLVQFDRAQQRVFETARWDLHGPEGTEWTAPERHAAITEAIRKACEGRHFRGRDAILSLGRRELFVQNIRIPKTSASDFERVAQQEAVSKLPFPIAEAELRFLDAAEVRQGDAAKREVIVFACHQPVLHGLLDSVLAAGLRPLAVDVEPIAMLRSYVKQFRRDEDHTQRAVFVQVGRGHTLVVIARGAEILFVKYIDIGGRHFDNAVSQQLGMEPAAASALRRHNGDRRADQQDPTLAASVHEAIRGVVERLVQEISLCIRYHSVTFRGQALTRLVLGGGEAAPALMDAIAVRSDVKCELGDPFRLFEVSVSPQRRGQWDVATGLALRELTA
ncbi:MAG TPA: pilus assembly protein PilM [Pirellulales bacterium]|jgi:type IV pilus assembly protein PilM|nr:pilus assembly protein PilM [Pirellulales bacterium]